MTQPKYIPITLTPREAGILLHLLGGAICHQRDHIIMPKRKRTANATRRRSLGQHIYLWQRIHHARKNYTRNN